MSSKPSLSDSQASEVVQKVFGLTVTSIKPLPSYDDQNFSVSCGDGQEFVLKIMNSLDSQNVGLLEVQTYAMNFLHQRGFPTQSSVPSVSGQLMSLQKLDCGWGEQTYLVRLLSFLPGSTISSVPRSPALLREVGKMAARLDLALMEMEHPSLAALHRDGFVWSLASVPLLSAHTHLLDEAPTRKIVREVLQTYHHHVLPTLTQLRPCINHGDLNDLNVLVRAGEGAGEISGVLDFSDMSAGFLVFELAVAMAYMLLGCAEPLEAGGAVLAGWEGVAPLTRAEREVLYPLVLCRLCQSLVLGRYAASQQPHNHAYLLLTATPALQLLTLLWSLGKEEVERAWFRTDPPTH